MAKQKGKFHKGYLELLSVMLAASTAISYYSIQNNDPTSSGFKAHLVDIGNKGVFLVSGSFLAVTLLTYITLSQNPDLADVPEALEDKTLEKIINFLPALVLLAEKLGFVASGLFLKEGAAVTDKVADKALTVPLELAHFALIHKVLHDDKIARSEKTENEYEISRYELTTHNMVDLYVRFIEAVTVSLWYVAHFNVGKGYLPTIKENGEVESLVEFYAVNTLLRKLGIAYITDTRIAFKAIISNKYIHEIFKIINLDFLEMIKYKDTTFLSAVYEVVKAIGEKLEEAWKAIKDTASYLAEKAEEITHLKENLESAKKRVVEIANGVKEELNKEIVQLKETITQYTKDIEKALADALNWQNQYNNLKAIYDSIVDNFNLANTKIRELESNIQEKAQEFYKIIQEKESELTKIFQENIDLKGKLENAKKLLQEAGIKVTEGFEKMTEELGKAAEFVSQKIEKMGEDIEEGIASMKEKYAHVGAEMEKAAVKIQSHFRRMDAVKKVQAIKSELSKDTKEKVINSVEVSVQTEDEKKENKEVQTTENKETVIKEEEHKKVEGEHHGLMYAITHPSSMFHHTNQSSSTSHSGSAQASKQSSNQGDKKNKAKTANTSNGDVKKDDASVDDIQWSKNGTYISLVSKDNKAFEINLSPKNTSKPVAENYNAKEYSKLMQEIASRQNVKVEVQYNEITLEKHHNKAQETFNKKEDGLYDGIHYVAGGISGEYMKDEAGYNLHEGIKMM